MRDREGGTELAGSWEIGDGMEESHSPYPSLHQIKQQANAAAWNGGHSVFLKAATESSVLPTSQCCIKWSDVAHYRCMDQWLTSITCVLVKHILVPTFSMLQKYGR